MNFYDLFKAELDAVTIMADTPSAAVVGECLRAAKRAQMVSDGELRPVAERRTADTATSGQPAPVPDGRNGPVGDAR